MPKLPFVYITAFMLASSAPASAGAAPADSTASTVDITLEQMQEVQGSYALSDGRTVRISTLDDRLYVQINRHDARELVAVGPNRFASRDRSILVEYKPGPQGDEIVVNYDSQTRWAKSAPWNGRGESVLTAARRL